MTDATHRFRLLIAVSLFAILLALIGFHRLPVGPDAKGIGPHVNRFSHELSTVTAHYSIKFASGVRQDEALRIFCEVLNSPSYQRGVTAFNEASGRFHQGNDGTGTFVIMEDESDPQSLVEAAGLYGCWTLNQRDNAVQVVLTLGCKEEDI